MIFLFKQYKKYIVYAKKKNDQLLIKKEEEIIPECTLDQAG